MSITDGYRTHNEGQVRRFRSPDLLTEAEFQVYMASTYGVAVEFRELTKEEKEKINSNEPIVFTAQGPTDRDRERALLRKQLGIDSIEEFIGINRTANPDKRDPIVELDSRTMSEKDFAEKYGEQPDRNPPKDTPDVGRGVGAGEQSAYNDPQAGINLPIPKQEERKPTQTRSQGTTKDTQK